MNDRDEKSYCSRNQSGARRISRMTSVPVPVRQLAIAALTLPAFACASATVMPVPAPCSTPQVNTTDWPELAVRNFRIRLPAGSKEIAVHCYDTACGRIDTTWGHVDWSVEFVPLRNDSIPVSADATDVQRCEESIHEHRAILVTGRFSNDRGAVRGHYFAVASFARGNTVLMVMTESATPAALVDFLSAIRTVQIL